MLYDGARHQTSILQCKDGRSYSPPRCNSSAIMTVVVSLLQHVVGIYYMYIHVVGVYYMYIYVVGLTTLTPAKRLSELLLICLRLKARILLCIQI